MRFYLFALFVLASTLVYSLAKPISDPSTWRTYPNEGDHSFGKFPAELIRNKRGISIKGNNRGDIHAPCTAVVCNKKKREVHFESEDTNEGDQKTLVESPLLESPDSDSSRQKRGISIGGNNEGDIHAPCTAVVCNKKKREVHMNSDKVETSETNAQISENQDFDQNSNLDTEKLKDPEVSANLGVSDISREKRGIYVPRDNNGVIYAPCSAYVCNKKKRHVGGQIIGGKIQVIKEAVVVVQGSKP